jgi:hypothetical protein
VISLDGSDFGPGQIEPRRTFCDTPCGGSVMVTLHPQYVIDENQKRRAVLLPLDEWERIVEELEELDEIRAYDEAKSGSQDAIPLEQAVREIEEDYKA